MSRVPTRLRQRLVSASEQARWLMVGVCLLTRAPAHAHARPFAHASSYSFDAPGDVWLSEDASGCDHHTQGVRAAGARTLKIVLYPDAYCSLLQQARCRYTFATDLRQAYKGSQDGMRRAHFTAIWDETCVWPQHALPDVVEGVLRVSEASDLGLQGTYDLTLEGGVVLKGVFDSTSCTLPRRERIVCL